MTEQDAALISELRRITKYAPLKWLETTERVQVILEAAARLEAVLAELDELKAKRVGLCRNGYPHYCPNCDNSFGEGGP